MTYTDAIQFLYDLRLFGAKFGLENTRKLAGLCGNPQGRLRLIHVAGTNGKGSVCAMLESVYRAAGFQTGLFTSPHLVSFAERIQVNRNLIPQDEVVRQVEYIQPLLQEFPAELHPTFFEVVTIMALRYFAEQQCEVVLLETGLGGRLDATNIVRPLASVITNIGCEHEEWLGDTIDKIAAEKAGIIKSGVPVVTGARAGEGLEVIAGMAQRQKATITVVNESDTKRPPLDSIRLPLPGHHQLLNAATAMATLALLESQLPVSPRARIEGLSTVCWPGRLQQVRSASGQTLILDAAHNPAGSKALREALAEEFPRLRPTLIFGVFQDKDWRSMCQQLAPRANRIFLVPVHSDRTEPPEHLAPYCRELNPQAEVTVCASLAEALQQSASDSHVVVTGSIYLVGEALELLRLAPAPPDDERCLNEWTTQSK